MGKTEEEKKKRHSQSVSRKIERKKWREGRDRIRRQLRKTAKAGRVAEYPKVLKDKRYWRITIPEVFSIIENTDETLSFFSKVNSLAAKRRKIKFDFSEARKISPDAILYILSIFDYLKNQYGELWVEGNVPKNPECRELLIESGFLTKVYSSSRFPKTNSNILAIESDSLVKPEIAKKVIDFAEGHIQNPQKTNSKSIYNALIECMSNTNNHAYNDIPDEKRNIARRWHLMAVYHGASNSVSFTFLDNGSSIPKTIRKKFRERLIGLIKPQDSALILSALHGDFRTQTELGWRGKGLPSIYDDWRNQTISNLKIVSRKGYVDCQGKRILDMPKSFKGTLLNWDFV